VLNFHFHWCCYFWASLICFCYGLNRPDLSPVWLAYHVTYRQWVVVIMNRLPPRFQSPRSCYDIRCRKVLNSWKHWWSSCRVRYV